MNKNNLFSACGEDANGFKNHKVYDSTKINFSYFSHNFLKIKNEEGIDVDLPDIYYKKLSWFEKMSKTHTAQLIKLRKTTKIIWKIKE